jgi:hypothetical protein
MENTLVKKLVASKADNLENQLVVLLVYLMAERLVELMAD